MHQSNFSCSRSTLGFSLGGGFVDCAGTGVDSTGAEGDQSLDKALRANVPADGRSKSLTTSSAVAKTRLHTVHHAPELTAPTSVQLAICLSRW